MTKSSQEYLSSFLARHGNGSDCSDAIAETIKEHGESEIAYLVTLAKELKEKLATNRCNSGHTTVPLPLWDCPVCTDLIRKENLELKREICERMAADSAAMSNVQNPGKTKEEFAIERKWPDIFEE